MKLWVPRHEIITGMGLLALSDNYSRSLRIWRFSADSAMHYYGGVRWINVPRDAAPRTYPFEVKA